jgi:adenosylmethionine-8-amino-7-oxononanoate aminotransferase
MSLFEKINDDRTSAQEHFVPHFTKGAAWRSDMLGIIDRGEGCHVFDTEGNAYLDGLAGLFCTNLGHGRQDLAAAASKQMERLGFYPTWGWGNPPAIQAASMIAEVAPGDLDEVFFVSSGSEAVESALKMVRSIQLARGQQDRSEVQEPVPPDALRRFAPRPQHLRRHRRRTGIGQGR